MAIKAVQLAGTGLRLLGPLFKLRIEWSEEPEGTLLASLNLPGSKLTYLNIELHVLGFRVLLGHIRFF